MSGQEDFPLPLHAPQAPVITTPDVQPPRPPNSWILYRAWKLKQLPPTGPGEPRRSQSEVSTLLGQFWRNETSQIRAHFDRLADEAKALHKLRYPNYRYQPKKKEDSSKPQAKRPAKARGVSGQSNAPNVLPAVERPGHPYPSSSRPSRDVTVGALPSPPLSAASSPEPSTPSSSYLPSSFGSPVLDVPSPSSIYPSSDCPSRLLPTPVGESVPATSDAAQHSLAQLEEPPNPDTNVSTVVWDYSNPTPLVPEVNWDTNALITTNPQTNDFSFDVAFEPSLSEEILRCGHTEKGPHQASCFLATSPEDIQNTINFNFAPDSQSEIDLSLGNFSVGGSIFEGGDNFYPNHNPLADLLDMPLYPRDIPTPPFIVDYNYFDAVAASVLNDSINGDYPEIEQPFLPTDPTSVYYFQDQEESSSQSANTSGYTPPSGAAQSSTRRVGGNWSGYIRDAESELSSLSPFEVQAN